MDQSEHLISTNQNRLVSVTKLTTARLSPPARYTSYIMLFDENDINNLSLLQSLGSLDFSPPRMDINATTNYANQIPQTPQFPKIAPRNPLIMWTPNRGYTQPTNSQQTMNSTEILAKPRRGRKPGTKMSKTSNQPNHQSVRAGPNTERMMFVGNFTKSLTENGDDESSNSLPPFTNSNQFNQGIYEAFTKGESRKFISSHQNTLNTVNAINELIQKLPNSPFQIHSKGKIAISAEKRNASHFEDQKLKRKKKSAGLQEFSDGDDLEIDEIARFLDPKAWDEKELLADQANSTLFVRMKEIIPEELDDQKLTTTAPMIRVERIFMNSEMDILQKMEWIMNSFRGVVERILQNVEIAPDILLTDLNFSSSQYSPGDLRCFFIHLMKSFVVGFAEKFKQGFWEQTEDPEEFELMIHYGLNDQVEFTDQLRLIDYLKRFSLYCIQ